MNSVAKSQMNNSSVSHPRNSRIMEPISNVQTINSIFEFEFHTEIFMSRCQDTGEKPDLQKAKMFKEGFSKINSKKHPTVLNLHSMRLGVNTIMKLISILEMHKFTVLNIADNSISEYGMHAVKNLLSSTPIQQLNLASNMISEVGLSLVLDDLIRNTKLKSLDLGILEGSIRKNSIGVDGARCLAAVLLQNKVLDTLRLEDNDIGINGAEIISIPLKRNKTLKELKIAENMIKTQGAEYILSNAVSLQSLDIGKNFIKSSIGPSLKRYLQTNHNLKRLNVELNELLSSGAQVLFEGVINSRLQEINIKGNAVADRGLHMIADIFEREGGIVQSLRVIDFSSNQISAEGIPSLIRILEHVQLKGLLLSKNSFGDEGMTSFIQGLKTTVSGQHLQRLDCSGCKISDKGFIKLLEDVNQFPELKHLKFVGNYISEKYEKIYAQLLEKNTTIINLNLNGNRLSLSGIKVLKRIIDRNLKNYEEREPKKIKSEIYNLKQKHKKIKQAQEKLQKQKRQIAKLQQTKARLNESVSRLQKQQKDKKYQLQQTIRKKLDQVDKQNESHDSKVNQLQKNKKQKEDMLYQLTLDLDKLRERRKQLQYQLKVTENEGEAIEKQFQGKVRRLE